MDFLSEAFKSLQSLTEETFDLSATDGQEELKDFIDKDDAIDTLTIIDDAAETEEELQDSYLGKVVLDCNVCHSLIYKDPSEVDIDDDGQNCNDDEECPYCFSTGDGFKLIGQIKPFGEVKDELKDEEEESEEDESEEEESEEDEDTVEIEIEDEESEEPEEDEEGEIEESYKKVIGGKSLVEHIKALKEGKSKVSKEKIEMALEDSGIFESCGGLNESDDEQSDFVLVDEFNRLSDKQQSELLKNIIAGKVIAAANSSDDIEGAILGKFDVYEVDKAADVESILDKNLTNPHSILFVGKPGQGIFNQIRSWLKMYQSDVKVITPSSLEDSDLGGALAPSFSAMTSDENMAKKIIGRKLKEYGDSDLAPIFSTFTIKFDKNTDENKITTDYKNKVFVLNPDSNSDFIYDKIVDALKEKVSESCDKNEACEKCGKNPCECDDDLEESIQDMSLTTDDGTTVSMESGEDGEVTIKTKPSNSEKDSDLSDDFDIDDDTEEVESDDETIGEIDQETEDEITADQEEDETEENSEEAEAEDESEEEVTDFDEESFEEMGESYLKKTYSNVESYKVSSVGEKGNKLFVEGLIKFKSGNVKKTNFVFESKGITKTGKVVFEGFNKEITGSNKAFRLTGKIDNSKFLGESLNYRYNQNKQTIKGKITR